jgi:hypothetical protein
MRQRAEERTEGCKGEKAVKGIKKTVEKAEGHRGDIGP